MVCRMGEQEDGKEQRTPYGRLWIEKALPVGVSYFLFASFLFLSQSSGTGGEGIQFCQKSKPCVLSLSTKIVDTMSHGSWACWENMDLELDTSC